MENTNQFTTSALRTECANVIAMPGMTQDCTADVATNASSTHETLYKAATLAAALLLLAGAAAA